MVRDIRDRGGMATIRLTASTRSMRPLGKRASARSRPSASLPFCWPLATAATVPAGALARINPARRATTGPGMLRGHVALDQNTSPSISHLKVPKQRAGEQAPGTLKPDWCSEPLGEHAQARENERKGKDDNVRPGHRPAA